MTTIYGAVGGFVGLLKLAGAWHARVLEDEVVSHAFSHGYHPQHTERLAAYWAEALGGPTMYSDRYGDETSVVRIHSGNGPHHEMDQRAIACFDQALEDVGFARDERLRGVLHEYFAWATTTTMARYEDSPDDVPVGLQIPKWSWTDESAGERDRIKWISSSRSTASRTRARTCKSPLRFARSVTIRCAAAAAGGRGPPRFVPA